VILGKVAILNGIGGSSRKKGPIPPVLAVLSEILIARWKLSPTNPVEATDKNYNFFVKGRLTV
jgi:hypothetical protein